jgi:hypothetical protein
VKQSARPRERGRPPRLAGLAVVGAALVFGAVAAGAVPLVKLSSDPYTNPSSQHATEVEPDTFAFGSTIVSAFQVGRTFGGGASNIGFAISTNAGASWTNGFLPGITKVAGGPFDRASDPSVAYDRRHNVWLISSLTLNETPFVHAVSVVTSRSSDGITWSNPITTGTGASPDKNWIVCDNTTSSRFYGNCYTQWDDNGDGNRIKMSTSKDGGLTWGPALNTADNATGLGGQPLVKKNGAVIVPIGDAFLGSIRYFVSKNGGASWGATKLVASITDHTVAGGMRALPLASAEIDSSNRVYIVWQDCRFRVSCAANDLVMATIKRGVSAVVRIPIDPTNSGIDHFTPGLAVDRSTGGATARLGLTYYYFPVSNCGGNCQLHVGFISSTDSGATWSAPTDLAGPMSPTWLPQTSQGRMVGDYISGSFAGGTTHPVFAVANAPIGGVFDEAMYSTVSGLLKAAVVAAGGEEPVPNASSDHPPATEPLTVR